jgi:hypothetical protein
MRTLKSNSTRCEDAYSNIRRETLLFWYISRAARYRLAFEMPKSQPHSLSLSAAGCIFQETVGNPGTRITFAGSLLN